MYRLRLIPALLVTLVSFEITAREEVFNFGTTPEVFSNSNHVSIFGSQRFSDSYANFPWLVSFHAELEGTSLHDRSIDLDRAWYRTPLYNFESGELTWGRIHPWEISLNPSAQSPWGLAGKNQAQNMGIRLGHVSENETFPSPTILGWIGIHYWSDPLGTGRFQWGGSISPISIPTVGDEFDFDTRPLSSRNRFNRPSGTIQTDRLLPIQYHLSESSLRSTLFEPQFMIQGYWDMAHLATGLENWMWLSNGPQSAPEFGKLSEIRAETRAETSAEAKDSVAIVEPRFPRRWTLGTTTQWSTENLRDYVFFTTLQVHDNPKYGYELGAKNRLIKISFQSEFGPQEISKGEYSNRLIQYEGQYPFGNITPYWGAKHHLQFKDAWFRTGVRANLGNSVLLDVGTDLFAGSDDSYFGPWNNNDRIFATLSWGL